MSAADGRRGRGKRMGDVPLMPRKERVRCKPRGREHEPARSLVADEQYGQHAYKGRPMRSCHFTTNNTHTHARARTHACMHTHMHTCTLPPRLDVARLELYDAHVKAVAAAVPKVQLPAYCQNLVTGGASMAVAAAAAAAAASSSGAAGAGAGVAGAKVLQPPAPFFKPPVARWVKCGGV